MDKVVALLDRGIIGVTGPDAEMFLQNLITNDMGKIAKKGAIFAALLTPQGKINFEFFVAPIEQGYIIDTSKGGIAELLKKLTLYKLRADVELTDMTESHVVLSFGALTASSPNTTALFQDPRSSVMGYRAIVPVGDIAAVCKGVETGRMEDYLQFRLENHIPEGGYDYALGGTFPHEAGYDLLDGVDFDKGCYVGQEVVSRMQHRGTARSRIVVVIGQSPLPDEGSEIKTDKSLIGVLGSHHERRGLALVRLDRAGKAISSGATFSADGVGVDLDIPSWADYSFSKEA